MEGLQKEIIEVFGNRLRVRASGILLQDDKILLIKHHSLGKNGVFWSPPGGGINFGETTEASLKREFIEETGLEVETEKFLFVFEYMKPPLHAIELFFLVRQTGGALNRGTDPELKADKQIIQELSFLSLEELRKLEDGSYHTILKSLSKLDELKNMSGYFH